ncbi:Prolactin [Fukomys damarensis]|uniref:Prolactin n=1 Tax=Fukomys damarensis TaxID=885580 RepID=A0A091D2I7_FUKDA|nr:Prolactin [Fukomys damarensis]
MEMSQGSASFAGFGRGTARPAAAKALRTVMSGSGKGSLLLLLLLSGLLLWKNVASQTNCPEDSSCWVCRQCLLEKAFKQLQYLSNSSLELFLHFYSPKPIIIVRNTSKSHKDSISTPAEKNQLLQKQPQDIIKLIIRMLQSWNKPLLDYQIEVRHRIGVFDVLKSKLRDAVTKSNQLQGTLQKLASQFVPAATDTVDSAAWTELASLQSTTANICLTELRQMIQCLNTDLHKISKYLMFLKCQVIYGDSC